MNGILIRGDHAWLRHSPPAHQDIRRLSEKFWKISKAEEERAARAEILSRGGKADRKLAQALRRAVPGQPGSTYCCPLLARRFQIFFVSRALRVDARAKSRGILITLLDPKNAVPFGNLEDIHWRKLNGQLRRRLERTLGKDVVVVGMGEVEADYDLKVWQPHHHLVIYGTTEDALKTLRNAHYQELPDCAKPMLVSGNHNLPGWCAYASKLMTFRKLQSVDGETGKVTSIRRVRLKAPEFRQLMRYLSRQVPTSFVFSMNCRIVR
jgi:hypothetical protein